MSSCGTVRLVPGPRGDDGVDGAAGTNGVNAYTTLGAPFTMPAELGSSNATVVDSTWIPVGLIVYLQGCGWLEVTAVTDSTTITLKNLEDTPNNAYGVNAAPGTIIAVGAKLVAAGPQGPAGTAAAAGAPTDASYVTIDNEAGLSNETSLAGVGNGMILHTAGVLSIQGVGNGDVEVPIVDEVGGLDNGEAIFATASGLESLAAADARTALGLGTMATQNANNVNITGGSITGVTFPTPSALPKQIAVYICKQDALAAGVYTFTLGAWRNVPMTYELADTDAIGSVDAATGIMTLIAGTYRARWSVPAYLSGTFYTQLIRTDTGALLGPGTNAICGAEQGTSFGFARFTLAGSTGVRLQGYSTATGTFDQTAAPSVDIYHGMIEFERESS